MWAYPNVMLYNKNSRYSLEISIYILHTEQQLIVHSATYNIIFHYLIFRNKPD